MDSPRRFTSAIRADHPASHPPTLKRSEDLSIHVYACGANMRRCDRRGRAYPPTAERSIGLGKPPLNAIKKPNREHTYADFCSLATTLEAFTCAVARTVVWAATANIFKLKSLLGLRDGGCRNGEAPGFGRPLLRWRLGTVGTSQK